MKLPTEGFLVLFSDKAKALKFNNKFFESKEDAVESLMISLGKIANSRLRNELTADDLTIQGVKISYE